MGISPPGRSKEILPLFNEVQMGRGGFVSRDIVEGIGILRSFCALFGREALSRQGCQKLVDRRLPQETAKKRLSD
jgi:hypothetical protein